MQREINDLKKQLRQAKQKQYPSNSNVSSNDEEDTVYRQRSRTPPSESFSCEDEYFHQISKSPFTRGIEREKLPRRFHQPTFAMYNGRTDPVEHVSQFK